MNRIDTPVVLLLFKRREASLRIIERVREVRPKVVYLLSDQGRDGEERALVESVRNAVQKAIDWDCTVVRRFQEENVGVYGNIALGARWVFERENSAIFLEDDNLPEVSFFWYCQELLERYVHDTRVLWVCGTNYLERFEPADGSSYMFTKHLLPCGWASWASKFNTFYDFDLKSVEDLRWVERVRQEYADMDRLFQQQQREVVLERERHLRGERYHSWDYHMAWSIRAHNLYGISPAVNQIKNIGVDSFATHGGTSLTQEMTRRFTSMASHELPMPLVHPTAVLTDIEYETKIGDIITVPRPPKTQRLKTQLRRLKITIRNKVISMLGLPGDFSIRAPGSLRKAFRSAARPR